MKQLNHLFLGFCLAGTVCACQQIPADEAVLSGKVERWTGEGYLLSPTAYHVYDTITDIQPDGTFRYVRKISQPEEIILYLEYLEGDKMKLPVYVANGKETTMQVELKDTVRYGSKDIIARITYGGDTQIENGFIETYSGGRLFYRDSWNPRFENGKLEAFEGYTKRVKAASEEYRQMLRKSKDEAFVQRNLRAMDEMEKGLFMRYQWACRQHNLPVTTDVDYVAFMNAIPHEDEANLKDAEEYVDWCMMRDAEPAVENQDEASYAASFAKKIYACKELIQNPKVVEALAAKTLQHTFSFQRNKAALLPAMEAYRAVSNNQQKADSLQVICENLLKLSKGAVAPDFQIEDVNGKKLRFKDVIGHGKVTYVDFWATWCAPCCAAIPLVEKLHEQFADSKDFRIVSISLDANKKAWLGKLDRDKPAWPQYVIPKEGDKEFDRMYQVEGIPRFMLFDKEGKIITVDAPHPSFAELPTLIKNSL